MDQLQRLSLTKLIPAPTLDAIQRDLSRGGSVLTHLINHLGASTEPTWAALAAQSERPFLSTPANAGPIDGRLLTMHQALDHLVLPWRRKYTTIELITPNPVALIADYQDLKPALRRFIPGGQPSIALAICTPACFREIFDLLYPNLDANARNANDHLAIAALIPATATGIRPTAEESACALAIHHHLPYIDPQMDAPDPELQRHLPFDAFISSKLYPHSQNEQGEIVTLAAALDGPGIEAVKRSAAQLEDALLQPLTIALSTHLRLTQLFSAFKETQP